MMEDVGGFLGRIGRTTSAAISVDDVIVSAFVVKENRLTVAIATIVLTSVPIATNVLTTIPIATV